MTEEELLKALIEVFEVHKKLYDAFEDPAARGVNSCIVHLQNYLNYIESVIE